MSNTKAAVDFLTRASAGDIRAAYEQYVTKNFKHHNPYFAAGGDALRAGMEAAHQASPNKSCDVQRTIEQGDFVWVHSRVRQAAQDIAVVHIFRFVDGRVAEMWDVFTPVPANSPNTDGVF